MHFSLSFNFIFWEFEPGWLHSNSYPTKVNLSVKEALEETKETLRERPQSYRSESSSC
jgi:hypothetical protein